MKKNALLGLLFFISLISNGQSKVFKEVNEDVSSEMKLIMQDNNLVGYLVFSQLEKANADSFNYRISLMDENLNDIGTVNFREEHLNLKAVSFEQDILCLVYVKSSLIGREFKNGSDYNNFNDTNEIFSQFITLEGKIIKSTSEKIALDLPVNNYGSFKKKFTIEAADIRGVSLKNIPGKGFSCFYKDKFRQRILTYDINGNKLWSKDIADGSAFNLLTTHETVLLLQRSSAAADFRRYSLLSLNATTGDENYDFTLTDGKSNTLNVLNIDIDPVTGTPYLSGSIVNQSSGSFYAARQFNKSPFIGVFTMDLKGATKDSIQKKFTYWNAGTQEPTISDKGFIKQNKSFVFMTNSFRDYNNNTYFIGTEIAKRPKFLAALITAAVIVPAAIVPPAANLIRLLYVPSVVFISGTKRWKAMNTSLLKLTPKGKLSYETSLRADHSKAIGGHKPASMILRNRLIYSIDNADTKNNFIISTDKKNITIYNVKNKKTERTIPLKNGNIMTLVFPAKEGHIMVLERNKKEKYTRLSIEKLN